MKIGILTAGGDCPGLNAAIRGVGKTAILKYGMRVFGFDSGFLGLTDKHFKELDDFSLSGILTLGGTILGTSREKPFKRITYNKYIHSKPRLIKETYAELGLSCLVCIGGNGTMKTAHKLQQYGLNIIGVPKTIDNDVWGTDLAFGFDSAVQIATEAIDRIHTTANSHRRIMVIEVMGHHAGWLALYSGVAGGGDIILIPELRYKKDVIKKYLLNRLKSGKPYSIVVVAEGIYIPNRDLNPSAGLYISNLISETTGVETRNTILGYLQRGGSPSATDRVLGTTLGAFAAELAAKQKYGYMVSYSVAGCRPVPLAEVAGKIRRVPKDHALIAQARAVGTCFGDKLLALKRT